MDEELRTELRDALIEAGAIKDARAIGVAPGLRAAIRRARVRPGELACPRCGRRMVRRPLDHPRVSRWECSGRHCRTVFTVSDAALRPPIPPVAR